MVEHLGLEGGIVGVVQHGAQISMGCGNILA